MKKHRQILFSTPMVEAILRGDKTVTRRTVKIPDKFDFYNALPKLSDTKAVFVFEKKKTSIKSNLPIYKSLASPYGEVGDILEVRETFYAWGRWVKNGKSKKTGKIKWKFIDCTKTAGQEYLYVADLGGSYIHPMGFSKKRGGPHCHYYKRPSLFMPKAAVRLFLEITKTKVERLLDITDAGALQEGVKFDKGSGYYFVGDIIQSQQADDAFIDLWTHINGQESTDKNPYVWVVSFKKIDNLRNG